MQYTFLFLNVQGFNDFESVAMRVKAEGNPIFYYQGKEKATVGIGIFAKEEMTDDYFEVLNRVPKEQLIILIDDNGFGDMADFLRKQGYLVIGGSAFMDRLEYERSLGMKLMKQIGLSMPEEYTFTDLSKGIDFLQKQQKEARFVFKPEGEDFAGSAKTYTMKNALDGIGYLRWIQNDSKEKHYAITKFVLQQFIEGEEGDFSIYQGVSGMKKDICLLDIEEKKSGDGNKGEAVGCMGNIIINFPNSPFKKYLDKLEPLLKKSGYIGQVSINCIFSHADGKPYGLELTTRFGWDAFVTECAIIKKAGLKISDFFISLVTDQEFKYPTDLIGCGIRVYTGSISLKKEDVSGRYFSFDKSEMKNFWFYSVSYTDGSFCIEDNPVLVAHFVAPKLPQAIQGAYEVVKKINVPDIYYRMEIGKRAADVIKFLNKYKWI